MKNTVIFDMDGVIVDTEPVHSYAYHEHFRRLGIDVSPELYATFTGKSTRNVYQLLKEKFGLTEEIPALIDAKRNIFNDAFDHKQDLFLLDGVENLIRELYADGFQLILASSSSKVTIDRVFRRFGLYRYFSHVVSGEDFPESKPDPAIFVEAARLSGQPKENCVVIEDSTNGVKASKAAGITCIGYDSPHSKLQDLSEADFVVAQFEALNAAKIRSL